MPQARERRSSDRLAARGPATRTSPKAAQGRVILDSALTARRIPSPPPAFSPRHNRVRRRPPAPARVVPRRQRRNPLVDVGLTAAGDPDQLPVVRCSRNDLNRIPRHPQQLREEGNEVAVRLAPLRRRRDVGADLPARKPSDPLRGGAGSGPDPQHHPGERTRVPSRRNLRAAQGVHGERGRRKCRTLGQVTHDFSTAAREVGRNGPEFRPYVSGAPRVLRAPDPRRRKSHV